MCRRGSMLFLCLALLGSRQASAAIAEGTSCIGEFVAVASAALPCTASGANRLVIGHVSYTDNSLSVDTVTYGGVSMTLNAASAFTPPDLEMRQYRSSVEPATGLQNFSVAFSGLQSGLLAVTPYTGVDQTTPVGTSSESHSGGVTSRSVDVTSAVGEVVVDSLFVCEDAGLSVGALQTQLFDSPAAGNATALRGSKEVGAGTVTMSWSWTNADCGMLIATPLKPAAAAVSGDFFFRRRH